MIIIFVFVTFTRIFNISAYFQASKMTTNQHQIISISNSSGDFDLVSIDNASSTILNNGELNTKLSCNPTGNRKSSLKERFTVTPRWAFLWIVYKNLTNHYSLPSFFDIHQLAFSAISQSKSFSKSKNTR